MSFDPVRALLDVVRLLEEVGIDYAIGGSVASSVHGEPRASADADLIADLSKPHLKLLMSKLQDTYYVSEDAASAAQRTKSSFNVIHLDSMYKIDIFVAGSSRLDREQLDRRVRISLLPNEPSEVYVSAAESIILRKLDWYRQSGEVSDRQWRDVLGVLKVQHGRLNIEYMISSADEAGLEQLLTRALREAGLAG